MTLGSRLGDRQWEVMACTRLLEGVALGRGKNVRVALGTASGVCGHLVRSESPAEAQGRVAANGGRSQWQ
jgi:hypothetical protein